MRSVTRAARGLVGVMATMWVLTACPGNATTFGGERGSGGPAAQPVKQPAADTLDVNDSMEVKIFGEPDLSGTYKVRSDGTIQLPLAGRVEVRGMTPEQASEAIAAAYSTGYLKDPQVTVVVGEFKSKKFFVTGEVNSPGVFVYEQDMTMLRAVIMAGGFTAGASRNSVLVTRLVNGSEVRMEIPVDDISQGKARNVAVMPGDIIYVPKSLL